MTTRPLLVATTNPARCTATSQETDVPDHRPPLDRRRFLTAGIGALLAACAGGTTTDDVAADATGAGSPTPSEPSPPASNAATTASPSPSQEPQPSPSPSEEAFDITENPSGDAYPDGIVPTRVRIPAIDVDTRCVQVNLTAQEVEVPDFGEAGWWVQTRKPGEIGPAVIGGHVDSRSGPDVFFRLKQLQPGDEITVSDDGGDERTFVVSEDPIQVDKNDRPPEVFGFGQPRPELRLITCGGDFNPNTGHYVDNIVVFCHDPTYQA